MSTKIAFILTMPGNNAWDGKWSGGGRLWAEVRTLAPGDADRILEKPSYDYDFGDGWYARVSVKSVDADEARALMEKSEGFHGYDWMIDRIISHGKILADHQLPKAVQP
jgi:hypothetical protein